MVIDLNQLKQAKPGEAATACMGWKTQPEFYRPPNAPGMIIPVLTIDFIDTLEREHSISIPPEMVVPFIATLAGWAASMMGGSAPQTPVGDDGQQAPE